MIGPDTLVSSKAQPSPVAGRGQPAKDDGRAVGFGDDGARDRAAFSDFVAEKPARSSRSDDGRKGTAQGSSRAEGKVASSVDAQRAAPANAEPAEEPTDVAPAPAGQAFLMALVTLSIAPATADGADTAATDTGEPLTAGLGSDLMLTGDATDSLDLPSEPVIDPAFDQAITRVAVDRPAGLRDLELDVAVTGKETHLDPHTTALSQDIIEALPKAVASEVSAPVEVDTRPAAAATVAVVQVAPAVAGTAGAAVAEAAKPVIARVEPEVARANAKSDTLAAETGTSASAGDRVVVAPPSGLSEGYSETGSDAGSQGDGFEQLIARVAKDTTETGQADGSLQAIFGAGAAQRASQTEQAVAAPGVQIAEQVAQDLETMDVASISTDGVVKVLKIELKPENLGSVSVSISLKDDVISLHIEAQRGETLHAIERERDQLIQALKQAGYTVDTVSTAVQVDARGSGRVEAASSSQQGSFGSGQSQGQFQGQTDGRGSSSQSRNGEQRPDGQQRSGDSAPPIVNDPSSGLARSRGGAVYV